MNVRGSNIPGPTAQQISLGWIPKAISPPSQSKATRQIPRGVQIRVKKMAERSQTKSITPTSYIRKRTRLLLL